MVATLTAPALSRGRLSDSRSGWSFLTYVIVLILVAPILVVPFLAFFPTENIWPHLASTVLPRYVSTTVVLLVGVGVGTFLLGVSSAWLVTMCRFPGQRVLSWALLLPLAMPAYVIAYVYTDLLEYAGPIQAGLRVWFEWQRPDDYWFPEVRSNGGAIAMFTLVLYPYVYLLARGAFLNQSVDMLEASRSLGASPSRTFLRVSLPAARPAIAVGTALALMETLNDFGTVEYFGVQTMTAGLYDVWLQQGNLGGAAQVALVMLVFVGALVYIEQINRRRQRHFSTRDRGKSLPQYELAGWLRVLAPLFGFACVGAGFLVPAAVLTLYAIQYGDPTVTGSLLSHTGNTLFLGFSAAVITVAIAMLLGYARRVRPQRSFSLVSRLASFGYAVPGVVIAIGVIAVLGWFDNHLLAGVSSWIGIELLASGSVVAILLAYTVRFLTIPAGAIDSALESITPSMDMASRSLGHGAIATFFKIHLPLVRNSALVAATIVFVDSMKELPATLVLRPFNFETLATHLYQFASDEQVEYAAASALIIVAAGLLPVVLLSRSLESGRARSVIGPHKGPVSNDRAVSTNHV